MPVNETAPVSTIGGYEQPIIVDRNSLRDLGVSKEKCQQFSVSQNVAQLNIIEFFHALPHYPIAFVKQSNNTYQPCAVLGLNTGENLFVDKQGNWQDGIYCPAYIRRYPFITQAISIEELNVQNDDLQKPVFVDKTALSKHAPSLFIANGVATAEWKSIDALVSDYISAEKSTLMFTQKLQALNLLQAFDTQIHPNQGELMRLKGMYRIDEKKLNKLPAKMIKALMQSGELSRIYAHLISLENFARLLDKKAKGL